MVSAAVSIRLAAARVTRVDGKSGLALGLLSEKSQATQRLTSWPTSITIRSSA
jgi:hypothetical protein